MADEKQPPLPLGNVLPEQYTIPFQTIDRWLQIRPSDGVNLRLTRADFDAFYFGLDKCIAAQHQSQQTLILYSQGKLAEANVCLQEAQRLLVESQNNLRRFMNGVMAGATVASND